MLLEHAVAGSGTFDVPLVPQQSAARHGSGDVAGRGRELENSRRCGCVFNWQIEACPHTGGALALTGQGPLERLHAVVWTGKSETRGLHFLTSVDAGSIWISGVRLGGEYAQRADLAARGDELVAVWDESVGQHAAVFV